MVMRCAVIVFSLTDIVGALIVMAVVAAMAAMAAMHEKVTADAQGEKDV